MIPLGVLAAGRPAAGGPSLTYHASHSTGTDFILSTGYTFPNVDLGPAVDRTLFIAQGHRASQAGAPSATVAGYSVTFDAVSPTLPVGWVARVWLPSSVTTGDITLTPAGNHGPGLISLYYYLGAVTLVDSGTQYRGSGTTPNTVTVDTAADGFIVAGQGCRDGDGTVGFTWSGATEDVDWVLGTAAASTAHASATTGSAQTVTATPVGGGTIQFRGLAVASYAPA